MEKHLQIKYVFDVTEADAATITAAHGLALEALTALCVAVEKQLELYAVGSIRVVEVEDGPESN